MAGIEKLSKKENKGQLKKLEDAGKNLIKDHQAINKTIKSLQDDLSSMKVVFTDDAQQMREAIDKVARQEITKEQEKERKNAEEIKKEAEAKEKKLIEGNKVSLANANKLTKMMAKFRDAKLGTEGLNKAIKTEQDAAQETKATADEVKRNNDVFSKEQANEDKITDQEKMREARYDAATDYHRHSQQTNDYQQTHRG